LAWQIEGVMAVTPIASGRALAIMRPRSSSAMLSVVASM